MYDYIPSYVMHAYMHARLYICRNRPSLLSPLMLFSHICTHAYIYASAGRRTAPHNALSAPLLLSHLVSDSRL